MSDGTHDLDKLNAALAPGKSPTYVREERLLAVEAQLALAREIIAAKDEALVHADQKMFSMMQSDYSGELDRADYPGVFGPVERALALRLGEKP
jgi:hypothetical protein